ncbi:MAG: hypothetical protein KatS3mg101_1057 [Patescibacteria group bacterium]|nr:MAG: hypothetical protein KatS3mg101_1057 [Patescibacteria group bacterium]
MATLGVTTIGSLTQSTNNALIMSKATAGESFTAVDMYVYIDPNSPSSTALSVSIFSDNAWTDDGEIRLQG